MAKWIDVPAHRVLCVPRDEFERDFLRLDANGQPATLGAMPYLIMRKKDSRRFMLAEFFPAEESNNAAARGETMVPLREI